MAESAIIATDTDPITMSEQQLNRISKAAEIFSTGILQPGCSATNVDTDQSSNLYKLENLMHKELKTWWNCTTLNSYLEQQMIPRGLRINKHTATMYSEVFVQEWNQTLSECSLKLMSLIVKEEQNRLLTLKEDIDKLQGEINSSLSADVLSKWNDKIQIKLTKAEDLITKTKKAKFQRDKLDYQQDKVYTWHREKGDNMITRPILKRNNKYTGHSTEQRRVSFSEHDAPAEYMNRSAYGEYLDSSNDSFGHNFDTRPPPPPQTMVTRSKNDRGRGGGGVVSTGEIRYPRRVLKVKNVTPR